MLLDFERKKMCNFIQAAFCQSPHSGSTGVKICSAFILKERDREGEEHISVLRWWLKSGPNHGLSFGTYCLNSRGLWISSQHKGIMTDSTWHLTILTTSGFQDLKFSPTTGKRNLWDRGIKKKGAQKHKDLHPLG